MGMRLDRDKFGQQKYRDLVDRMYKMGLLDEIKTRTGLAEPRFFLDLIQEARQAETAGVQNQYYKNLGDRVAEETRLMEPNLNLSQAKIGASLMGSLEKDTRFLSNLGLDGETIMDSILSKQGTIGEYAKYVDQEESAGREPLGLLDYIMQKRKSGATRISIGEKIETAAGIRGATTDVDVLGKKGYEDAVAIAERSLKSSIDYQVATPGSDERKKLREDAIASAYESVLRAQFGNENVSPLINVPGKGEGWKVRKSDGTTVWKGRP